MPKEKKREHTDKKETGVMLGRISLAGRKGGFFMPEGKEGRENETPIDGAYLNTAMTGDKVEIGGGKVLRVLERSRTHFSGTVKIIGDKVWLKPYDTKVYSDILVTPDSSITLNDGERIVVEMTHWDKLEGRVIKKLGIAGDNETEMGTIMFEHKIQYDFPEAVKKEAEEIVKRV
ncbi:MAG: hypothetical protein AAB965_03390, partial [Patescibacteria group bacterium]